MSQNASSFPYLLQLNDGFSAIHLTEENIRNFGLSTVGEPASISFIPSDSNTEPICLKPAAKIIEDTADSGIMEIGSLDLSTAAPTLNFVYEIVYPEELNLKPMLCGLKRGRPKKQKVVEETQIEESAKIIKPAPRTRSGRVIKFPKHIEKDFKKIEVSDETVKNQEELRTTEFTTFADEPKLQRKQIEQLEFHQRKRKISAQYRCPKCKKAYLGKNKMIEHIKKNPSHGPLPDGYNDLNFDVWNYLVDITQKCPPSQRGTKFCEELTNLLHNLLLLTSALFKKHEGNKNEVRIDKVLGNAIGLPAGSYHFDDNKLYKDVTVLKLITDSEFFKPTRNDETFLKNKETEDKKYCICEKSATDKHRSVVEGNFTQSSSQDGIQNMKDIKIEPQTTDCDSDVKKSVSDIEYYFTESIMNSQDNLECNLQSGFDISNRHDQAKMDFKQTNNEKTLYKSNQCIVPYEKMIENVSEKIQNQNVHSVHPDLLSDSSLLNSLPVLRNSVDELILSGGSNILDNSSSSDEVMNVDQFVIERFKKITEPELELTNTSLNLDLPTLDLFQFHNS